MQEIVDRINREAPVTVYGLFDNSLWKVKADEAFYHGCESVSLREGAGGWNVQTLIFFNYWEALAYARKHNMEIRTNFSRWIWRNHAPHK